MLRAESVKKSYGSVEVLKGVNLHVQKGEIVSVVGASGAGKSTLLHILGTLDDADTGIVEIGGIVVNNLSSKELAVFRNRALGFIFQFHNLLPEFTAHENVMIPGVLGGKDKVSIKERASYLLDLLGVGHRANHKPSELSGGEQQRCAVARALMNSPEVVFADEPSGNLDSKNAQELHELFFRLREELQQTFVIVTHNDDLANLTDRKLTMKDGFLS